MTIPAKDLSSGLVPQRTPAPVVELDSTDEGMRFGGTNSLSGNEQQHRLVHSIAQRASTEISALLSDSTLRRPSSVELGWKNFSIERRSILPGERPELTLQHHFLILWDGHVAEGEMAYRGGRFSPYKKHPNTITTCLPGIRPAARNRSKHEVIVGALSTDFIRGIEAELDRRPSGTSHGLHGADDPDLRNLLLLLFKESETGGGCGTLYAESLIAALATRLLYAARLEKLPANDTACSLPPRLLRRVVDLMQADLSGNLDLATLAAESGYSRSHFLSKFRAATGQTPHRFLMDLRLAKAQALLAGRPMRLIDIAAACGFSSHSHLTTAFQSKFGLSPSAYRRAR
jgi:AraC family transcriptional regulator